MFRTLQVSIHQFAQFLLRQFCDGRTITLLNNTLEVRAHRQFRLFSQADGRFLLGASRAMPLRLHVSRMSSDETAIALALSHGAVQEMSGAMPRQEAKRVIVTG